jgi:hypothetical protein
MKETLSDEEKNRIGFAIKKLETQLSELKAKKMSIQNTKNSITALSKIREANTAIEALKLLSINMSLFHKAGIGELTHNIRNKMVILRRGLYSISYDFIESNVVFKRTKEKIDSLEKLVERNTNTVVVSIAKQWRKFESNIKNNSILAINALFSIIEQCARIRIDKDPSNIFFSLSREVEQLVEEVKDNVIFTRKIPKPIAKRRTYRINPL